jgi:iron complex outermembrane receptor protein
MKAKQLFIAGMITLAASHAAHAEEEVPSATQAASAVTAPSEAGILPEVTVTSTTIDDRFDSKRGEPSNYNYVSGKKVDDEHGKNLVEVLESVPGVTAEVQSGDSVKIMLRGVEAQRYMGEKPGVAIVVDGVPVQERTGRVNIDLDNIESIKVIKGGASYLFGEDALSGAVVITTKRGAKMAGITESVERGSFGYSKTLGRVGIAEGNWVGHVQASHRQTDGYHDQGESSAGYLDGKLQYMIDGTSDLTFGFEQSKRAKDSHGTVRGVTAAALDPQSFSSGKDYARKYDVDLAKLNLTYAKDFGSDGNLLVNTYLFKDHTFSWSNPSGYIRGTPQCPVDVDVTNIPACNMANFNDLYVNGGDTDQAQRGLKSEWRKGGEQVGLMAGLDLQRFSDRAVTHNLLTYSARGTATNTTTNRLNLAGAITTDSLSTSDTKAVYGEFKWQATAALTGTLNARYDNIGTSFESYIPLTATQVTQGRVTTGEKTFNVWSERVGMNYALSSEREIYANASTGFRVPTISQLYGGSITPTGTTAANPNLSPEKSWNREIGLRAKSEVFGIALDMDAALFQIDRKNFILNTGGQYQVPDATDGIIDQYQNIGGVRNRGVELGLKTDAKQAWSADVAYTYISAVFTRNDSYYMAMGPRNAAYTDLYNNTGNDVPRTPRHKMNLSTRYRYTPALTFSAEMNTQSGFFADEVNMVRIGGRTLFNAMVNYDVKTGQGMKLALFGRIDNLFARRYYSTIRGGSDADGNRVYNAEDMSITVDPGRVWAAGLTLNF